MSFPAPPVTPARLVGKAAHDALTATYGGKTPSAGNWIGATNDDDGIATTLCFSKDAYATPTTGAGSAGLQAARELRSTLTSAHSSVTWLPPAVHITARAAVERCLEIAARPLDVGALNLLDVVAEDILARGTYEVARPDDVTRTPALGNVTAQAYFESAVLENLDSLETYAQLKNAGGNWRYMIGSQSYPVSGVEHPAEAYREALKVFGRHKNCECGNVSFAQFKNGLGIIATDLEKSIGVFGSGEKTSDNPSLSLVLNGVFQTEPSGANALVCDHFMHHECLLKISNGYVERLI